MEASILDSRANVSYRQVNHQKVFIYEDHRYILNILYWFRSQNPGFQPHRLFYFDYHDDALAPGDAAKKLIPKFRRQHGRVRDFWSFTEFDLSGLDNDWLLTGMALGLISDAVLFGAQMTDNISRLDHRYIAGGKAHRLYHLPHVWELLGPAGLLGAGGGGADAKAVRDILKFDLDDALYDKEQHFTWKAFYPYVLDFDCDVFANRGRDGKIRAWSKSKMQDKFDIRAERFGMTGKDFVKKQIERASFITICKESPYCGGFKEGAKVFERLDELFFEGKLGS